MVTSSPVTAVVPELGGWGVTAAAQVTAAVERVRRGPSCAVRRSGRRRWVGVYAAPRQGEEFPRARLGWVDVSDRGLRVISPESHPHTFVFISQYLVP